MVPFWRGKQRCHQEVHFVLYYFAKRHCIPLWFGRWKKKFQSCIRENPKDTFPHAPFLHGHSVLPHGATGFLWEHLLESPTAHCQQEMMRKNLFLHISVKPVLVWFQQFHLPLFPAHFYGCFQHMYFGVTSKRTCLGKGATEETHSLFI